MQFFLHSYGDFVCPATWEVPEKSNAFNRLYYIKGGVSFYRSKTEQFPLIPGHLYLFPQNSVYSIRHDPKQPLHTLYFHITAIPEVNQAVDCDLTRESDRTLLRLAEEYVKRRETAELEHLISALLLHCAKTQLQLQTPTNANIDAVLYYIHNNYCSPHTEFSSAHLAGIACHDESYFIRKFKECTGFSPKQYILNLKLEKAAELIGSTPLKEICVQLAFHDYRNFSGLFRRKYGLCPSDFLAMKHATI